MINRVPFDGVQIGRMDANSALYSFYNVLAASLVAVILIAELRLSFALIQGSWIFIGPHGLSRRLFRKKSSPIQPVSPLPGQDPA